MTNTQRTDEYVRHTFQLLAGWFTFFVTVNWASLGWLAANSDEVKEGFSEIAKYVSWTFAYQNLLGMLIVGYCIYYFREQSGKLITLEREDFEYSRNVMPKRIYSLSCALMILGLLPMTLIWFFYPIIIER